jgi:superoxide reductase
MEKLQIYKCEDCGAVMEVLHGADCEVSCHGKPLKLMKENTVDAAREKHVPVVEKLDGGFKVRVGSVPHPMEEKHWIQLIEIITDDGRLYRKYLDPGDKPEAVFHIDADKVTAREHCNIHGLWRA